MKTVYMAVEVLTRQVFKGGELISSTKEVKNLGVRSDVESAYMLCSYRLDELDDSLKGLAISVDIRNFSGLAQLDRSGKFNEDGQTFSVGKFTLSGVSLFDSSLTFKESCELLVEVTNYK